MAHDEGKEKKIYRKFVHISIQFLYQQYTFVGELLSLWKTFCGNDVHSML